MKSTRKQWLLVAILLVSLALAGCSFAPAPGTPGTPNPDTPATEEDLGIRAVYASYVAYAEKNEEKPLSYENWLASIRGKDGVTPTVEIGEDGYWVINGVKTAYKAIGQDGAPGKDGAPGVTPTIEISEDGYWVINGVKSDKKATGADGKDGVSIASVTVDEAGRLVITLSNGTTLDPIQLPVGSAHEHTLGEWQIVGGGNACDECFFIAACNDCGEIKWRMGTEADHKYDIPVNVESTCTQQGYTGVRCSVCQDVKITEQQGFAEHSFGNVYSYDDAQHWQECQVCFTKEGYGAHDFTTSQSCSVCGCLEPLKGPMSYAEYSQAADDTPVVVSGIVSGIASRADGDTSNILYLQDERGEGGYYVYNLSVDPVANLGLAIGMKVTVSGTKDTYSGIYEVVNASVEEIDTEIVPLAPLDFTEIYKNAEALTDKALTEKQSAFVTVKGVELKYEENTNGYYHFQLGNLKSYVRISKSNNCIPTAEIDVFHALHTENVGCIADVTGILQMYNGAFYLIPTGDARTVISNISLPERTDAEKVAVEMGNVQVTLQYTENTVVTLPLAGSVYPEVAMSWVSDSENAVIGADGTMNVTIPNVDASVSLTVTLTCGNEIQTKTFTLNLISNAAPVEVTIPEALALPDGTSVIVRGTVKSIDNPYNATHDNISVTIEDAEGNTLSVYRLNGNWEVGDVLVITGKVSSYKDKKEIAAGATAQKVVDDNTDDNNDPTDPPAEDNDDPVTPPATGTNVVFTFGENGDAAHVDGQNYGTTTSFTSGDYTLTLTDCSKVYGPAYDLTGVSCIKMGTSSEVGTFTFEVDENVKSVVIRVAAYKAKNSAVTINETEYTVDPATNSSNNGAYMEITIDTTTVKTITVSTVSGKTRVMIDSIAYVI